MPAEPSGASDKSFNAITVDSDTSTSDSVYLVATGHANIPQITDPDSSEAAAFFDGLLAVMTDLAQQIVRDGEGAQKFVTNVTGVEKTAIENFYNARSGEFEAFSFDLSHINESGTITTRFDGTLKVQQVLSTGSQLTENFFTVSFNLKETFD